MIVNAHFIKQDLEIKFPGYISGVHLRRTKYGNYRIQVERAHKMGTGKWKIFTVTRTVEPDIDTEFFKDMIARMCADLSNSNIMQLEKEATK